jgi:alpha-tubulin suppressor-like RCC1 family protein/uncharacterized protein YjdB
MLAIAGATLAACGGGGDDDGPGVVGPAAVASVQVQPATVTVAVGATTPLTVVARDAAGAPLAGRSMTWSSSDRAIAFVDASGVVTGVASGTATITATSEGRSGQSVVTVSAPTPAAVASVVVTPATGSLRAGDTLALAATARDAQGAALAGRTIRWTSSAPAVATVDAERGVVRGVAAGTATITATSEGRTGEATVTVTARPAAVATLGIGAALDTLEAFETVALTATPRDSAGNVLTGRTVRWTSSDPAVATIDSLTGRLVGVDRGTVTITATSEGVVAAMRRVVVIRYRSLAVGAMHACDIASGGIAWCWGLAGREGRLGDGRAGDEVLSNAPVRVSGTVRFAQLASYGRHTCGLTADGEAYCWGYNGWGQLGASGPQLSTPAPVVGGPRFRSITVGADHSCGVTADGRAYCWGAGASGELGDGATAAQSTPVAVTGGHAFASLDAGSSATCGVTSGNAALCWGLNAAGQLGVGSTATVRFSATPLAVAGGIAFRSVSVGSQQACGVSVEGQGYCWGVGTEVLGLDPAPRADVPTPTPVSGELAFRTIDTGNAHSCGLTTGGSVWCWGANRYGQLGTSTTGGSTRPVPAGGALRAAEVRVAGVATGLGGHTCAIAADRLTTYCWGVNSAGQLGNGTTTPEGTVNATPSIVHGQRPLPAAAARR